MVNIADALIQLYASDTDTSICGLYLLMPDTNRHHSLKVSSLFVVYVRNWFALSGQSGPSANVMLHLIFDQCFSISVYQWKHE